MSQGNGLGLLEKFEKAKREAFLMQKEFEDINSPLEDVLKINNNQFDFIDTLNSNLHPSVNPILTSPDSENTSGSSCNFNFFATPKQKDEILEKMNYYRELINLKDDEKFHFTQKQNQFFDFFEKHFAEIYNFQNLGGFKKAVADLENIISNEENREILKNIDQTDMTTSRKWQKKNLLFEITNIFTFLDQELRINRQKENKSIENLRSFSNSVIDLNNHSLKDFSKFNLTPLKKCFHNINNNSYLETISNRKTKNNKRKNQLLSTALIKKSKSLFGEDDELMEIGDKVQNKPLPQIIDKNKKLVLRNFLQIYLVKENEIFSQTYFSKFDHAVLYSYRKYRYYEIKLCISIEESMEDIKKYLDFIKSMFHKYVIIYRTQKGRNYIKVIVCGVGKNQAVVKKNLINFVNKDVKKDCLIKISFFSTIFDCLAFNLNKLNRQAYNHHTNFNEDILQKVIRKSKKLLKK